MMRQIVCSETKHEQIVMHQSDLPVKIAMHPQLEPHVHEMTVGVQNQQHLHACNEVGIVNDVVKYNSRNDMIMHY